MNNSSITVPQPSHELRRPTSLNHMALRRKGRGQQRQNS